MHHPNYSNNLEGELTPSQQKLLSILNHQNEMIYCLSPDSTINFVNESYCAFLNKMDSDIVGHKIKDVLSPSQGKKIQDTLNYIRQTGKQLDYEYKILRFDDKVTWHRWSYTPILDKKGKMIELYAVGRDITRFKLEQERLRNAEKTLRSLFDSQTDPYILLDKDQEILMFNKPANQLLVRLWNRPAAISHNIKNYIYPEDLSSFVADFDRAFRGEHISREKQWNDSQGITLWHELNFAPVYDDHGNISAISFSLVDITKRKKIAQEIKRSRLQQNSWLDALPYLAWSKDQKGRYLSVNRSFTSLINKKMDEIIGKTDYEIWNRETAKKNIQDDQEILNTGKQSLKEEIVRQGSDVKWFETFKAPIYDDKGKIIGISGISREITHLKKEQKSWEAIQGRFREYIEKVPVCTLVVNQEGRCEFANRAASELLAYPTQEFKLLTLSDIIASEDSHTSIDDLINLLSKAEKNTFEIHLLSKHQIKIPVLLTLEKTEDNKYLFFCKNITEFKKLSADLQEVQENAAIKSQFLSTVSHEIRTPLNAVIALSHLLIQEDPKPEQIKSLNTLKFSAENLLALINDILDYNKIESGRIHFENIDFDLHHLISSIKDALSFKAQEKNIPIVLNYDPKIPSLLIGDPVRLSQIITNLLDNAIKFTHEGYVRIDVQSKEITQDKIRLQFMVSDTGIGIEQSKIKSIFERFTQASSDTTRKFGGTGLGLAITKKLLELQDSNIQVESRIGYGSKFYFFLTLPISKKGTTGALRNPLPSVAPKMQDLRGARILMVEDNEINKLVTSQFLTKWNANIDYADNGQMAIDKTKHQDYDIILMDLELPVMDGYETVRRIRKMGGKYKKLPIIALTASSLDEVKDKVFEAGMNDCVVKPFTPRELYKRLAENLKAKAPHKPENLVDDLPLGEMTLEKYQRPADPGINVKKIIEISGGNKTFIRKYNELTEKVFKEFPDEYKEALLERDFDKLRKLSHNIKATVELLELHHLDAEINLGKELLKDTESPKAHIEKSIRNVKELCEIYAEKLDGYL